MRCWRWQQNATLADIKFTFGSVGKSNYNSIMKVPVCGGPHMRRIIQAGFATLALFASFGERSHAQEKLPNIVFIIADDLGYGDLGSYGQKKIRTPNLDRLAGQGMRFTQGYSGHNVCAPSRCVLMSGKHPGHAFIRDNRQAKSVDPKYDEGQIPVPA